MTYQPLINRNPLRMREVAEKLQEIPIKRKGLKWLKKDWRWVQGKKKFRIYSMRIGQATKYKLAFNETGYLWNEVSAPSRSSWEVADTGRHMLFKMLIDGVARSNTIKQSKEEAK